MDISTLKAGDEVYVFSYEKDRYVKRVVEVDRLGGRYFYGDPAGYFKVRRTVILTGDSDAVTAEELPAAKKRHAARRKAEKAAETARETRHADAAGLTGELFALGVATTRYGKAEPPSVDYCGVMVVSLTVEQARVLLGALKGKV